MTIKEKLHQIVEALPEERARQLVQYLQEEGASAVKDIPANFTLKYGAWQDDRSAEEIVRDIRAARMRSGERTL